MCFLVCSIEVFYRHTELTDRFVIVNERCEQKAKIIAELHLIIQRYRKHTGDEIADAMEDIQGAIS